MAAMTQSRVIPLDLGGERGDVVAYGAVTRAKAYAVCPGDHELEVAWIPHRGWSSRETLCRHLALGVVEGQKIILRRLPDASERLVWSGSDGRAERTTALRLLGRTLREGLATLPVPAHRRMELAARMPEFEAFADFLIGTLKGR